VLDFNIPALIHDYSHRLWRYIITKEFAELIQDVSLAIIPVKISDKTIDVVCAQYFCNQQESDKHNLKKELLPRMIFSSSVT
jgi:hypothetical protein